MFDKLTQQACLVPAKFLEMSTKSKTENAGFT